MNARSRLGKIILAMIAGLGIAWGLGAVAGKPNLGTPGWIAAGVLALWASSKLIDLAVRKPSGRPSRRKTS